MVTIEYSVELKTATFYELYVINVELRHLSIGVLKVLD